MKITIKDVALEAGVSKATVSRVLSNHPSISEPTKEKVQEVIERLGYTPNQMARSLARSKTKTLGVIFPRDANDSFSNPIYIQMMQGISKYAQDHHYYLMYAFGRGEEEESNIREFTSSGMVDGLIILKSEINDKAIKMLREMAFPFVVIGRPESETSALWVDNDNFGSTFEVTQHLIEKGYKEIGFIGAKPKWTVAKDRLEGYKRALEIHNIEYRKDWVYHGENFNETVGKEAYKAMQKGGLPKAIIATDDLIAVGFQEQLIEQGKENIPVIGFNNTIFGSLQRPEISSVEIYGVRLGYEAAGLLIGSIEEKKEMSNYRIVDTQFVGRGILKP